MVETDKTEAPVADGLLKKGMRWLVDKVADRLLETLFALWLSGSAGAVFLTAKHKGSTIIAALRSSSVPLWLFLLLLLPAAIGVMGFVRRYALRRSPLHVISDPISSLCCEAKWGDKPCLQIMIRGSFTNRSNYPLLLMYAYIRGTTAMMHFEKPMEIPANTMSPEDVLFFVTRPSGPMSDPYQANLIFVDAGGSKFRQRLRLRYLPGPKTNPDPQVPA